MSSVEDNELEEVTVDQRSITILTDLYERDGKLTPEQVVSEAADPSSPLHDKFVWDNDAAAHLYRLEQARGIIRKVRVFIEDTPVRAFQHVKSAGTYAPVREALANVDYRAEILATFARDAERFETRWRNLTVVAAAYDAWLRRQQRP